MPTKANAIPGTACYEAPLQQMRVIAPERLSRGAVMAWLTENWSQIASFICGLAGGSLLTVTIQYVRNRNRTQVGSGSMVDQSGARAGGDVIGRDKETTTTTRG
jgi:hypothetical protein